LRHPSIRVAAHAPQERWEFDCEPSIESSHGSEDRERVSKGRAGTLELATSFYYVRWGFRRTPQVRSGVV